MISKHLIPFLAALSLSLPAFAGPGDDLVDPPITPEQVAQIKAAVERIRNAAKAEIPPETIGSPDTAFARLQLQTKITEGITAYLGALADIDAELRAFFSKIIALKNDADAHPKDAIRAQLLQNELKRIVPSLNASINQRYSVAIQALYLRNGYPVAVRLDKRRKNVDDYVWFQDNVRIGRRGAEYYPSKHTAETLAAQSFPHCVTGACVYALSESLREWFDIVDAMNQEIDVAHFGLKVDFGTKRTTPFLALAMVDSAERLLKDPKRNVSYTLGAYLGELLVHRAGGVVIGVAAAPALLLEKVGRVAVKVFTAPTVDLELKIKAAPYFTGSEISGAVRANSALHAPKLPAVLYGKEIADYETSHPMPKPENPSQP